MHETANIRSLPNMEQSGKRRSPSPSCGEWRHPASLFITVCPISPKFYDLSTIFMRDEHDNIPTATEF